VPLRLKSVWSRLSRKRLDRVRRERAAGLAGRLLAIGKDCAAHLKEPFRSVGHGELYDERGLPR